MPVVAADTEQLVEVTARLSERGDRLGPAVGSGVDDDLLDELLRHSGEGHLARPQHGQIRFQHMQILSIYANIPSKDAQ